MAVGTLRYWDETGRGLILKLVSQYGKGKGKSILIQTWTGSEGSSKL